MFICPSCSGKSKQLIVPPDGLSIKCGGCYQRGVVSNTNLHMVVQTYVHKGVKKNMTYGKAWEIDHRGKSPDDPKKIINLKTGKEAQY